MKKIIIILLLSLIAFHSYSQGFALSPLNWGLPVGGQVSGSNQGYNFTADRDDKAIESVSGS